MYGANLETIPDAVDGNAALEELRRRVHTPQDGPKPGTPEDKYGYSRSDVNLVRFLIARQWDVEKATVMLREHYQWLQERKMAALLKDPWPEEVYIKKYYPQAYHGTDKQGRPIYIERPGQIDMPRLLQHTTADRIIDYFCYNSELQIRQRLPACGLVKGDVVDKSINILDLDGLGFSIVTHSTARRVVKEIIKSVQDHYPECCGRVIIINAPKVFSLAWSFVKPLLDEKTVSKISIFDSNKESFKRELLKEIDADQLPKMFGGACICDGRDHLSCMTTVKGPWKQAEVLEIIDSEPLERLMIPEGAKLLLQRRRERAGSNASSNGVSPPPPPSSSASAPVPDTSPRASSDEADEEIDLAAPLPTELGTAKWEPNTELEKAKWAVAELADEYRRLEQIHMQTLAQWVEEFNSLVEEIGRPVIERSQAYYDSKSLCQQVVQEYAGQQGEVQQISMELEAAQQKLSIAEEAFAVRCSRASMASVQTFLSEEDEEEDPEVIHTTSTDLPEEDPAYITFLETIEDPVFASEPKLARALWISHLGDVVTRLQFQRDSTTLELDNKAQELLEARRRFERAEYQHRGCTWNCSVTRAEPFYEKRKQHESVVDGQLQQLHELEKRMYEARHMAWACTPTHRLARRTADNISLASFEIAGAQPGEDEFEFHSCGSSSSSNFSDEG